MPFFVFVSLLLGSWSVFAVDSSPYRFGSYDATVDASNTHASVKNFTASGEAINANLTQPLMSSKPLSTFQGKTFTTQLSCPSSQKFLEILMAPGPSGDIATLNIQQDTNLDGRLDYLYSPPFPVSGVCANGVIACQAGSWNHCQAYQWASQTENHQISLVATGLAALGGCYCVNNHCGGLVMRNLANILGDLGGGITAQITQKHPLYAISKVEVSGPTIQYYGQDRGNCGAAGQGDQSQYFKNPNRLLPKATSSAAFNQTFQLLSSSVAAQDSAYVKQSCTLARQVPLDEVTLDDIIVYNGGSGGVSRCGVDCLQLVLGSEGNNYWNGTCSLNAHQVSYWVERPDRILSATLVNARFDDHIQVSDNGALIWAHDAAWTDLSDTAYPPGTQWWCFGENCTPIPYCERKTNWNIDPNLDFTPQMATYGAHAFKIRVAVSGGGEGYAYAQIKVDEGCYVLPEKITDTCQTLQADPLCTLEKETVDGVVVYDHFTPTGLVPIASDKTIVGSSCAVPVSKPWWLKERIYHCQKDTEYDFSQTLKRAATIKNSATDTGYDDYRLNHATGTWQTLTAHPLVLPEMPAMDTCTQACRTTLTRPANDVAGLGPTQDQRNNPTTQVESVYHECSAEAVCPLGEGETLVQDCQCLNNFAEATAIMQSIRMAGRDMICTSGTPRAVQ